MDELNALHDFWRQESPKGNYFVAIDANARSSTIVTALLGILEPDSSVLEVGCNVGRNLNHLYRMGYTDLAGVEINPHAVARLRTEYPHLAGVPVSVGSAEDVLPSIPDNAYDIVFTMAVLEHIHPDSAVVFREIVRIADRCVLAIEPRFANAHDSRRQHPWDVTAEYVKYGVRPVFRVPWPDLWAMPRTPKYYWQPSMDQYDATVFLKESSSITNPFYGFGVIPS
jgi:SAM-dependent methyltransferase